MLGNVGKILKDMNGLEKLDPSLADGDDKNLIGVLQSVRTIVAFGMVDMDIIEGAILVAYAAGRVRGRKEAAMKGMLEGMES